MTFETEGDQRRVVQEMAVGSHYIRKGDKSVVKDPKYLCKLVPVYSTDAFLPLLMVLLASFMQSGGNTCCMSKSRAKNRIHIGGLLFFFFCCWIVC